MSDFDPTIEYYNQNAEAFAEGTINADMSDAQNRFIAYLKPQSHIFDIGCGSGRDSKFFIDNGFNVTAMDASQKLCVYASNMIKKEVLCMTFDQINFKESFDAAWACASLLHISKSEIITVLKKISDSLKTDGVFYASFKYGTEERESNGRVFSDYTETDIPHLFSSETNLKCIEYWISTDVRPERESIIKLFQ